MGRAVKSGKSFWVALTTEVAENVFIADVSQRILQFFFDNRPECRAINGRHDVLQAFLRIFFLLESASTFSCTESERNDYAFRVNERNDGSFFFF